MDENSQPDLEQTQEEETVSYLPFHAINEFMRSDFRMEVIRTTLQALPSLPEEYRVSIDQMTRRYVSVPGFRNSAKAPAPVKARAMAKPFEEHPELVGSILAAWSAAHPELRSRVYEFLTGRGMEILPPEADRSQLPGFLPTWPKAQPLETLTEAFEAENPGEAGSDDVTLMIVWLTGRLPFAEEEDEAEA